MATNTFLTLLFRSFWVCGTRLCSNFTIDGIKPVRLAYSVYGKGENKHPLIILHGLFGCQRNWRSFSRILALKLDRQIFTLDARNHGESEHSPLHSAPAMAVDLVNFLSEQRLTKACVMGHCMGGRATMYFALQFPEFLEKGIIVDISHKTPTPKEFTKLVATLKKCHVEPTDSLIDARRKTSDKLQEAMGYNIGGDFFVLNLQKNRLGECFWTLNLEALEEYLPSFQLFGHNITKMPPYNGPMTFICGTKSGFFNPDDWPETQKIFPNAEIHWIKGGHLLHYDQTEAFMNLLLTTLETAG